MVTGQEVAPSSQGVTRVDGLAGMVLGAIITGFGVLLLYVFDFGGVTLRVFYAPVFCGGCMFCWGLKNLLLPSRRKTSVKRDAPLSDET